MRKTSAFLAMDTVPGYSSPRSEKVVYIKSTFNPGGHYNSTTGEYKCGVSGIYYFTFSILVFQMERTQDRFIVKASLMKEGIIQGAVSFTNANTDSVFVTLSQSVLLECQAGEKVWVHSPAGDYYFYGSSDNMFAGILLSVIS